MSSILRALKKLEEEKATHRHTPIRIDADILCSSSRSRISPSSIILTAALLFLCGSAVTYVFMVKSNQEPPLAQKRIPPQAASSDKREQEKMNQGSTAIERTNRIKQHPDLLPFDVRYPARGPVPLVPFKHQAFQPLRPVKTTDKSSSDKALRTISQAAPMPPMPTLRVDGIAFQDGSDGVAVVNGIQVSKGSSIDGARVDEVQRDRVLFSHEGKKIEIQLGKSNR